MPGIVGLLTRLPRPRAERQLRAMVASLGHEPFYRVGTWIDEELGVYIGWSAHAGAFADGMPVRDERGNLVLVFSGEDFAAPGTIEELRRREHVVDGVGAGYLAHLAEESETFPAGLNGRFHGLLVDRRRGTSTLFNDRYGMHRLYYAESTDGFYFAAEAKAILAVRPELRRVDPRGLGEFVSFGCVLEDRTLFRDLRILPAASRWTFRRSLTADRGTYFSAGEWEDQPALGADEYYAAIRDVFSRHLPRYFQGPGAIGMSLTGGLDTRMIMAWQRCAAGSLPCYSFGGMFRDCQDVRVAHQVADVCGQPHQVIPAQSAFLGRFAHYAERTVYLTDGCADVSLCPDLYIYERSRQIAPVRMTGNYGGEVLRRVTAFKPSEPRFGLFDAGLAARVADARRTYADAIRIHPLSFAVFRQGPWFYHGSLALEGTQLTSRTPYLDNDFVRTVFRAPESACRSNDVCLRLIADGNPRLRRLRTDRGLAGRGGRVPSVLSRALLEFSFKAEYAYDYGMPQWLAKVDRVISPLGPERLFLGRHKFYHFRVWYRDALAGYVRGMLLDPRALARPYLVRRRVEAIVGDHLTGRGNYTSEIHKLLTLELVHRLFVDDASAAGSATDRAVLDASRVS